MKKKFILILGLIFIILVIFLVYIFLFFRIKNVYVKNIQNRNVILSIQQKIKGQNLLFESSNNIDSTIRKYYSFASSVSFKKVYPSVLYIYIKSLPINFIYKYKNSYYDVSSYGTYIKTKSQKNGYITVSSSTPIKDAQLGNILSLLKNVSTQFVFEVSKYTINNYDIVMTLSDGKDVLLNFHKPISLQISQIIGILTSNNTNCNTINVEFQKIYCQN